MRIHPLLLAALCVVVAFSACTSAPPLQVKTQFDGTAPLGAVRTFRWLPGGPSGGSAVVRESVRQAIQDELTGRGYVLIESGQPDAWVSFHVGIAERIDMSTIGYGFKPGVEPVGSPPTAALTRGSIMIDVLHPASRELLWRGVAGGLKTNPVKAGRRIREAVRAVLAEFPPLT